MGFLRRFLGRDRQPADSSRGQTTESDDPAEGQPPADIDADERARELELARFEQDRFDDLLRRQQRYADRSWTPPAQGGERRADDADSARR